jgi:queuine tRNA-ribosyltransferase
LRHLFISKEILAPRLNTIHNLHYYMDVIRMIQTAIAEGRLDTLKIEAITGEPGLEEQP